jgi:hypothetical protein
VPLDKTLSKVSVSVYPVINPAPFVSWLVLVGIVITPVEELYAPLPATKLRAVLAPVAVTYALLSTDPSAFKNCEDVPPDLIRLAAVKLFDTDALPDESCTTV